MTTTMSMDIKCATRPMKVDLLREKPRWVLVEVRPGVKTAVWVDRRLRMDEEMAMVKLLVTNILRSWGARPPETTFPGKVMLVMEYFIGVDLTP